MRNLSTFLVHGTVISSLVLICGCGSNTATVKGTVTYKGAPVDYGSVVFFVGDKQAIPAQLGSGGAYEATGVPFGEAKVEVHSRPAGQTIPKHSKTAEEAPVVELKGVVIPENYTDKEKSGLSVSINKKVVEFKIELKDPS
jgi:hypothetical protein